jgi:murein DD-endopeptidase MepM/ murein hydrolase activator NlpD
VLALGMELASGQTPAGFPTLDVRVPVSPRPLVGDGATHLVYELHITNLSTRGTVLDAVDVRDPQAPHDAPPLLHLEAEALDAVLQRPGAPANDAERRVLPGGRTSLLFMWLTLRSGSVPEALTHRFETHVANPPVPGSSSPPPSTAATEGQALTISGVEVPVSAKRPRVLRAPIEGDHWLAANGPDNAANHRRTLLALAGQGRIAQRFAIDWVRLFDDGRTFRGDPRQNTSYRAFGAQVRAVSDGTVVETVDGIPENVPDPVVRAVAMTPKTLGGNYVLQNLGDQAYAFYAHLQPGSLKVKKGERVRRGQLLALVGNTGNSTEPHLHFHVADRESAFDSEGVPYAFTSFELEARPQDITPSLIPVGDSLGIDAPGLAKWRATRAQRRASELPMLNAVVTLSDR